MTDFALRRSEAPPAVPARMSAWQCVGVVAAGYVAFCVTYLPINAFTEGRVTHTLFLPGEAAIPLVPGFEFVYALGYVLPIAIVLRRPDRARMACLARAFGLTLVVAYATYLLFPVYLQRPLLTGDSPAIRMLTLEYRDKPYNHFPSLHVAIATLVTIACSDERRLRWWLPAVTVTMAISTLFVKQHYIVDVAAGAAVAAASWRLAARASS